MASGIGPKTLDRVPETRLAEICRMPVGERGRAVEALRKEFGISDSYKDMLIRAVGSEQELRAFREKMKGALETGGGRTRLEPPQAKSLRSRFRDVTGSKSADFTPRTVAPGAPRSNAIEDPVPGNVATSSVSLVKIDRLKPVEGRTAPFAEAFECEISLTDGAKVFDFYHPPPQTKLDRDVARLMVQDAPRLYLREENKIPEEPWKLMSLDQKIGTLTWDSLTLLGRQTYVELLFRFITEQEILPRFLELKRSDLQIAPEDWVAMSPAAKRNLALRYNNLSNAGKKILHELLQSTFPLLRSDAVPDCFQEQLAWDAPGTIELKHKDKTPDPDEVDAAISWVFDNISPTARSHRHISWEPDLAVLKQQRKEFLSFLQRTDLLMFAERLEKKSVGALYGSYGRNTKPYSLEKLKEIDRSLDDPRYSVILGSKLHGAGLRTYAEGRMGIELRAPSELSQIRWYRDIITQATSSGSLGTLKYDEAPLVFTSVPRGLEAQAEAVWSERGLEPPPDMTMWIEGVFARAGLDERVSFPCLDWESQPFVTGAPRDAISEDRKIFLASSAQTLARFAAGEIDADGLRQQIIESVWLFAQTSRLSDALRTSIQTP